MESQSRARLIGSPWQWANALADNWLDVQGGRRDTPGGPDPFGDLPRYRVVTATR